MSPLILHIYGSVWVTAYGLFTAIGLAVFLISAYRFPEREKYLSDEQFFEIACYGIVSGLLGGKLLFLLQEGGVVVHSLSSFVDAVRGGFAILGAIVGAIAGVVGYAWWNKIQILPTLDIAGRYALLAHSIARLGCFYAGCCYGIVQKAGTWCSVMYRHPASLAPHYVPLFPSQLLMSVGSLLGFFCVAWFARKPRPRGSLFILYFIAESTNRFVADFWRGDRVMTHGSSTYWFLDWSAYQWHAVWMILVGMIALTALVWYSERERV